MACTPSEDSDQPGHPPSLIAVRIKKAWADAQADLSLRWAHSEAAHICSNPLMPGGLCNPYQMDKSVSSFRGVWHTFSFLFLIEIHVSKQSRP